MSANGKADKENMISYRPEESNGVLIVLREPGGEACPSENKKDIFDGSTEWFKNLIKEKPGRTLSTYRNRFKEYLDCVKPDLKLEGTAFANISYRDRGKKVSQTYKDDLSVESQVF